MLRCEGFAHGDGGALSGIMSFDILFSGFVWIPQISSPASFLVSMQGPLGLRIPTAAISQGSRAGTSRQRRRFLQRQRLRPRLDPERNTS